MYELGDGDEYNDDTTVEGGVTVVEEELEIEIIFTGDKRSRRDRPSAKPTRKRYPKLSVGMRVRVSKAVYDEEYHTLLKGIYYMGTVSHLPALILQVKTLKTFIFICRHEDSNQIEKMFVYICCHDS